MERGPSVANPDSPMPSEHNQSPPRHGIDTPKYREETFSPFSNSVSTSASDYRSVRSSPSPVLVPESSELRRAPSDSWQSSDSEVPSFRSAFSEKEAINAPLSAQNTISLSVASRGQADGEDTPIPSSFSDISGPIYHEEPTIMGPSLHNQPNGRPTNGSSLSLLSRDKSLFSRGSSFNVSSPSPPGSSIGSESAPPSSVPDAALSFEAQIKASPFIDSIMQRLANCEYSSREIQRELGDVHRKLDLLVQRSQGNNMNQGNGELEFRNPFASPSVITPGNPSQNFNVSPFQNGPAQRGSTAGVNPDDITQLSQRLNTLTTSVGQLLAIQTQQHIQNTNAPLQPHRESIVSIQQHRDSIAGFNSGMNTPQEIAPNQLVSPPINAPGVGLGPGLGHGFPPRDLRPPVPGVRTPNPPMRTWSAGSLELPMRPQDNMNRPPDFARKRGSVATGLMRRESSGVYLIPFVKSTEIDT
ncbi:hypothetical protein SISSUDRAFT_760771 [Sistotremastrum suecicum HHB10207 ss-3]|uniref:Uncharacterized protein n=1 Tax=Sistotremastrum suecicum HHB10207 ss-3 TaxID=1314776 RepID=A0A166DAR2_9AGAM|nr:hypothetical protein SISSUDRAFT_760771 [Sistotremastrum suecicum HHB10207 ss-3]